MSTELVQRRTFSTFVTEKKKVFTCQDGLQQTFRGIEPRFWIERPGDRRIESSSKSGRKYLHQNFKTELLGETFNLPARTENNKFFSSIYSKDHYSSILTSLQSWGFEKKKTKGKIVTVITLSRYPPAGSNMCYLTWKFRFWRGADSLGPHFGRIVDKSQPQISVEIIVAPGDSSRRVWNVRNVQGNLKRHVRVYHVQNLKSVKSRRRVKISPVHRLWSHHRMPVAIRTCWTSFQTPKYTPPGSNFDRTEAFFLLSSH